MNTKQIYKLLSVLFISLCITSCTDTNVKQQMESLQMENDSLKSALLDTDNCCECGEMPSDLMVLDSSKAREALLRYETEESGLKIRGTWLDKEINWYLYCTFKSNIFSGIGLNEGNCPVVIYAVQLIADEVTTYKFFTLSSDWTVKDCEATRTTARKGTCPNRCP
jgi:hypothetical protein